jgi:hypothetical protein
MRAGAPPAAASVVGPVIAHELSRVVIAAASDTGRPRRGLSDIIAQYRT